jgi:hypothetical protein
MAEEWVGVDGALEMEFVRWRTKVCEVLYSGVYDIDEIGNWNVRDVVSRLP